MRTYDYLHQGLTEGGSATAGKTYTVIRTKQNLKGLTDGWIASKFVTEDGLRLFVREGTGSVACFGRDDILR
ncbi:hypothetical protein [Xylella phage Cota]|uniref:Uncharacterized protein n=1 Tax=Xylella phage Cota TaxID=2699877 RepID=A0A6F8ZL12_9CAUD|nr:hypothetical protein [Xylella phage Cota]